MAVYTKNGDKGKTTLFGGKTILKSDLRVEAYGTVDELSSYIGLLSIKVNKKKDSNLFILIQKDLYHIMAYLALGNTDLSSLSTHIKRFEKIIDSYETVLPRITKFILPQGTELSVEAHICRTICRRTERAVVRFFYSSKNSGQTLIIPYLNRLSDLLFTLARAYNTKEIVLG
ncbi:MAG: cob(I)yrinic acid a,c-diamide adenosyltransferase [Patescibacteria group bacterium]